MESILTPSHRHFIEVLIMVISMIRLIYTDDVDLGEVLCLGMWCLVGTQYFFY